MSRELISLCLCIFLSIIFIIPNSKAFPDPEEMREGGNSTYSRQGVVWRSSIPIVVAALADRIAFHPLETITTFQQSTLGRGISLRQSITHLYVKGGAQEFYKGFLWPLGISVPNRLGVFSAYRYQKLQLEGEKTSMVTSSIIAGLSAALVDAVTRCPADAYRTRALHRIQPSNPKDPKILFRGLIPTTCVSVTGVTITLAGSDILLDKSGMKDKPGASFLSGTLSGGLAQLIVTPLDTWKTRVMCNYSNEPIFSYMKEIINEGVAYKTLSQRLVRISLGSGLMIWIIDVGNRWLSLNGNKNPYCENKKNTINMEN